MVAPATSAQGEPEVPPHRYRAALANEIEARWQQRWADDGTYGTPNPVGDLAEGFDRLAGRPKLYVLDMFPYPSGVGLHVGHPLGYIGTDVWARYKRMSGFNVLHTIGFDAFGLPAEQYAVQTGQHPRITTEANIATTRRQFRELGLGHDERRAVATTDVGFLRWTQWIFLQLYGSWYDPEARAARPVAELVERFESGQRRVVDDEHPQGRTWSELSERDRRRAVDAERLVYRAEAPVNWCPGLGTVLANEEVTSDGRSERGNFPVFRRPLTQWMMRITAYADRLLEDLDIIDWPEPIKLMQRNWIGRSEGARVDFPVVGAAEDVISVFTTRPDTVFGATYMVLSPEHELVERITTPEQAEAVADYRRQAASKSDVERSVESREKTGVPTGAMARNPATGEAIGVWVADYVLAGYGTGAIMAVPGQDQRDWDFAERFDLPIVRTVQPPDGIEGQAYVGEGPAINSGFLDGLGVAEAKGRIIEWLEEQGAGRGTVNYKLRDWLFSRQRYWGEPFPIVFDESGLPVALPESMLPVELPEIDDYAPRVLGEGDDSVPEPPLGRATAWREVELDLGDGPQRYQRELNTMPQWAGSCWYYLRYLDPTNDVAFVDPEVERYWMVGSRPDGTPAMGGVDLYVGGVEHAVLHLLYSRFWHKVLFDLGHVSTPEPFERLYNQGYIQAPAYLDERGLHVEAAAVTPDGSGGWVFEGRPVTREMGKMGKSLKNAVSPEDIYGEYGADTLRLYEMAMGPLDADRPWSDRDIIGVHRFLARLWRALIDEESGELRVLDVPADEELRRAVHRTIAGVADDMDGLRFNTAVAKLIELTNALPRVVEVIGGTPREVAEPLVLLLAPLAPHLAEELWSRLGHESSVVWATFPEADPALLVEAEVELPVQVAGKVRGRITVPRGSSEDDVRTAALADARVQGAVGDRPVRRVVVVPDRLVNVVL
ncbi:MAG: leucine--tRNA ligase [Acidimicrobiia bacterium]|nr:leucine--tRNA ligase [Acidimicrobiia bacterium]